MKFRRTSLPPAFRGRMLRMRWAQFRSKFRGRATRLKIGGRINPWWIRVAVVIAILIGAWAAAAWLVPNIARERVVAMAKHRFGLHARVRDVGLGLGSLRLEQVELRGSTGGIEVRLRQVVADASVWALLFRGTSAIDAIRVDGVEASVDLSREGAKDSFRTIRSKIRRRAQPAKPSGSSRKAGSRAIQVHHARIRVRDRVGLLVDVQKARGRADGASISGALDTLQIGDAPTHRSVFRNVQWALKHGTAEQIAVVDRITVEQGRVQLIELDASKTKAPTQQEDRLLRRLKDARAAVLGPPKKREPDGDPDRHWTDRLAPDANLSIEDLTVRSQSQQSNRTIIRELRARVRALPDGRHRLVGRGKTASASGPPGEVAWDLRLSLRKAAGEGSVSFEALPLALVSPFLPAIPWHEPAHARLDGQFRLRAESPAKLAWTGSAALRNAALASPRIGSQAVRGVSVGLEGNGYWFPPHRRLRIDQLRLRLGDAFVQLSGDLERSADHYRADLKAELPTTACDTAIRAIPVDLLAELTQFSFAGSIAGKVDLRLDSRELSESLLDIDVNDRCKFVTVPGIADLRRVRAPFVHRASEPDGTVFEMMAGPGSNEWVPLDMMSPYLIQAVIAHEDASFFQHSGFAPWAIKEALVRNLEAGRYVQGASTITMQLAKNLFLQREKTLARKVQEVLLTWWLENAMSKRDILELYLNLIEYGPGIYGIRHAAEHYFGRLAGDLSPAEAAFFATILPNPKRYHHYYERGRLTPRMAKRLERFLKHMAERGRLDPAALDYGIGELDNLQFRREGEPALPPHRIPTAGSGVSMSVLRGAARRTDATESSPRAERPRPPQVEAQSAPPDESTPLRESAAPRKSRSSGAETAEVGSASETETPPPTEANSPPTPNPSQATSPTERTPDPPAAQEPAASPPTPPEEQP